MEVSKNTYPETSSSEIWKAILLKDPKTYQHKQMAEGNISKILKYIFHKK
jgi:hypothetical protein